jgi:hypothetical protein
MALSDPIAPHSAARKQLRSYRNEVSSWGGKIARRYVVGLAILTVGVLLVLVAAGFGVAAISHFFALHYGVNIALLVMGGFFLVVGLIAVVAGRVLMERPLPPLPKPYRQAQELNRAIALDFLIRGDVLKQRVRNHFLVSAAGAAVVGWVAGEALMRLRNRPSNRLRDRAADEVFSPEDR